MQLFSENRKVKFSIITIILVLFTNTTYAKEVKMVFGLSVPPYIIPEENSGMEMDIIRESLAKKGLILKPVYTPFLHIREAFANEDIDAVATVEHRIGMDGFFSDTVITYYDYAFTLDTKNIKIDSINDLINKKVAAFQLASQYMGTTYHSVVTENPHYRERQDQIVNVRYLYEGKTDVVISDDKIFEYYRQQLHKQMPNIDVRQVIRMHHIFPPSHYQVVFRDQKLRDTFNEGLRILKEEGLYQDIIDSYQLNTKQSLYVSAPNS